MYHFIILLGILSLLGSKVDKPSEISIKISNSVEYIESDIQNIEAPRIDDPIINYL